MCVNRSQSQSRRVLRNEEGDNKIYILRKRFKNKHIILKVLLIEDEARAANRLERMIKKIAPDFTILAKPESVNEAVSILQKEQNIQLIFSDIELGDGVSFEIFQQVQTDIPIIFTTAYNRYAIDAFKVNGVDYLLKPIKEEELIIAIEKFRKHNVKSSSENILSIAKALEALQTKVYKKRFLVKVASKLKSIPTEEIAAFYSMEKATYLVTKSKRNYVLDQTLGDLMTQVNPEHFFKVSRKHIVAIDAIEEIIVFSNSRLLLKVNGMETQQIIVAREKVKEFKEWLE